MTNEGWESLVEAKIDAIFLQAARKELKITLIRPWDNSQVEIVASGVEDILINDLRLQNIVDRVQIFERGSAGSSRGLEESLFRLMRGRDPLPADLNWPLLHEKSKAIESGVLKFLQIEPVHGAIFAVMASDIQLRSCTAIHRA